MLYPALPDNTLNSTHPSSLHSPGYFTAQSAAQWEWQDHEIAQPFVVVQVVTQTLIDGGLTLKAQAHAMEVKVSQGLGSSSGRFYSLLKEAH